jgi:hypothetical protein
MEKFNIKELPKNMKISKEEKRRVFGALKRDRA